MDERWDRLFADLESRTSPALDEAEIPDLIEAERVSVRLADRLVGAAGRDVDILTASGSRIAGTVSDAAPEWVIVVGLAVHVVPLTAIRWVTSLDGPAREAGGAVQVGFGAVVRRLARSGLPVVADVGGASVRGTLSGVGADYCDVATESGVCTIPFGALISLRFDAEGLPHLWK